MKRIVLGSTVAALLTLAASAPAQTSGATAQNPAGQSQPAGHADASEFIQKMAVGGMAEVQMGKLATQHAASAEVKEFGQMMVKDHTQANNQLKQVASQLNVQLPKTLDKEHQDLADRLSKLKGAEFDREYMDAMVKDHKEDVSELRSRAGKTMTSKGPAEAGKGQAVGTTGDKGEQALTQWAAKTLPVIEKHLQRAEQIQQKLGKSSQ
jgi:putative membrane protein